MEKTRKANAAKWFGLVEKFMDSEVDKKTFCREEQVNIHTFNYWHKKYGQKGSEGAKGFLSLSGIARHQSIYIRYRNGVELELPCDTPSEQVLQLVHAYGC